MIVKTEIDTIIQEILSGEYHEDVPEDSAVGLIGEWQAQYFSLLRNNLRSDMAHAVITNDQRTYDLELLRAIKS